MSKKIPTIAIVGRTNVGKSTLFNSIAGHRITIVQDEPGVTRDRSYTLVKRHGFPFTLIDTGGLVGEEGFPFEDVVRAQTEIAIEEADLVLALFDGVAGVHPQDSEVVDCLRRSEKPVLWVVNKCEKPSTQTLSSEFYSLGIEDLLYVSAAHKVGMAELIEQMRKTLGIRILEEGEFPEEAPDGSIRVAVLGRPNVGKSTFVNQLLGENRLATSPIAGTTRDAIDVRIDLEGQGYVIVDTAGLRRKARVEDESVERYANLRTLSALSDCDVVVLMLDATSGDPSDQDKRIAALAHERGRGLIIAMNKWDLIEKDHKTAKLFQDRVQEAFRFTRYAPILFISAASGKRCTAVLKKAKTVYRVARERVQTSKLNRVLAEAFRKAPPPAIKGVPVKLFFTTQIDVAPPTFVVFVNHPGKIPATYERYLKSSLREEFSFEGSDLRLFLRKKRDSKPGPEDEI